MSEIFAPIAEWYMAHINYFTVCLLMTIESSFIPFPSEIVVPPAAWKAAGGELSMALVLASATLGALLGALLNYFLARTLGRKVVYALANTRVAHMMLISEESLVKAEKFFVKYGAISTLNGRLVTVVRQLISLPAGLAKMPLLPFILYTAVGAFIWNVILALAGYYLHSQKELLERYFHQIAIAGIVLGGALVLFFLLKSFRNRKAPQSKAP